MGRNCTHLWLWLISVLHTLRSRKCVIVNWCLKYTLTLFFHFFIFKFFFWFLKFFIFLTPSLRRSCRNQRTAVDSRWQKQACTTNLFKLNGSIRPPYPSRQRHHIESLGSLVGINAWNSQKHLSLCRTLSLDKKVLSPSLSLSNNPCLALSHNLSLSRSLSLSLSLYLSHTPMVAKQDTK